NRHLNFQLISRNHWPAKSRSIHCGEKQQLVLAIRNFEQQQQATSLGHCLDNQYTGHHWLARKMPLKMRVVNADVLYGDDALEPFPFQLAIYHQKRIAMRQILLDFHHIHDHSRVSIAGPHPSDSPGPPPKLPLYRRRWHSRRAIVLSE